MYKKYFKRLLDLFFAIILFILTLPIVGIASLIIFILDKGQSPLFKQQRVGKDEVKFNIYKLRTMAKDENGVNQVTKFGKILRDTSIDELPQLINIIKGEMSFIGTDSHDSVSIYNNFEKAMKKISKKVSTDKLNEILVENPNRVLNDKPIY